VLQVIAVAGEYDPHTGRYAYPLVTVSVPRQCGKTDTAMKYLAARTIDGDLCWYTADNGLKARARWRDFVDFTVPKRLKPKGSVKRGAGSEVWAPPMGQGGRLRPFPPSRDSLHGEQVDAACIDEAWSHDELDGSALTTALVPAQQTRRAPQTWALSTAGDAASTWWDRLCEQGRAGTPGHAHFEWRAPDDESVFNPDTYPLWHPGAGHLFLPEHVPDMLAQLSPDDAIRSLGNRTRLITSSKWPPGSWAAGCVPAPDPMPPVVALAVDVSPDRSWSSVSAAHALPDGRVLVQLLTVGEGTGWLVGEVETWAAQVGRHVPVAYDTRAQAAHVVGEARTRRVRWEPVDTPGYVRACSGMYAAILSGEAVVLTSPELDTAAGVAADRPLTDTWVWSRGRSPGDITPLVACSLAWHVATTPAAAAPRFITRRAG
jgi:hypothetical protein